MPARYTAIITMIMPMRVGNPPLAARCSPLGWGGGGGEGLLALGGKSYHQRKSDTNFAIMLKTRCTSHRQVELTSWLGTSASAAASFAKAASSPAPAVSIAGGASQAFSIAAGMRLSAEAGGSCKGGASGVLLQTTQPKPHACSHGTMHQQLHAPKAFA